MRIVLIGINYAPEIISTAVYSTGLAEDMAARGHAVCVITAQPYYPAWKVMDGWPKYTYRSEVSASGVRITHCPLYVPSRPSGMKRILHHITFAITAMPIAIARALREKPDLVVVVAPSLLSGPVGWIAARLSGARTWLHIQDFEVEAAFATQLLKADSFIGRQAMRFEAWLLKKFDRVSTISRPMLDKLRQKGVPESRIHELRNWANLSKVTPLAGVSPLKAELGISTPYVALYSGNLANKQGLEIIPEAARKLAHRKDITIAVCGDGPMRERLMEMSADVPTIRFFPLQPLDRLSDLLGMATLHLLPQIAGAADLVLPSKLTNILASGRPVIATTKVGTALADEVADCGLVTSPGDAAEMAKAIEALLDSEELRRRLGRNARQRALEHWDGAAILGRFADALANLVQPDAISPHEIKRTAI